MGSAGTELLDDILLRFLFARKDWKSENYDIGASAEMLRNHLAWYAAKRPDQLLGQYHCPKFTEYYQCGYHGRDKFGCQVYYERPGAMKVQELFSLYDDDDLMKLHALVVETGRRFYDRAYGGTANGICVVMDLGGISRAHLDKRVFDWIGRASKIDAANYPEHLAHCYIINTGLLTRTAWGMVKPMLEKRTSGKVEFLGGPDQYLPKLRQRMSDDIIPSIFGPYYVSHVTHLHPPPTGPPHTPHPRRRVPAVPQRLSERRALRRRRSHHGGRLHHQGRDGVPRAAGPPQQRHHVSRPQARRPLDRPQRDSDSHRCGVGGAPTPRGGGVARVPPTAGPVGGDGQGRRRRTDPVGRRGCSPSPPRRHPATAAHHKLTD